MKIQDFIVGFTDGDVLLADGFDDAFIGLGRRCGEDIVAVYDRNKAIQILSASMSMDEAIDYFEFNVVGSWVGPQTPIFVEMINDYKLE